MGKRGIAVSALIWIIIGVLVLAFGLILTMSLSDKGSNAIEFLLDKLRFGR